METDEIRAWAGEVRGLLADRLRARAPDLDGAARRARRLLPRRLRRAARTLAQAERMAGHPRLHRQIDVPAARRAHAALAAHLAAIDDPAARRRARLLDLLAFVAFVLLLAGVGAVAWLRWRGLV